MILWASSSGLSSTNSSRSRSYRARVRIAARLFPLLPSVARKRPTLRTASRSARRPATYSGRCARALREAMHRL